MNEKSTTFWVATGIAILLGVISAWKVIIFALKFVLPVLLLLMLIGFIVNVAEKLKPRKPRESKKSDAASRKERVAIQESEGGFIEFK
jgi:undecaprenyl pyrophosphate phosphatase UppP